MRRTIILYTTSLLAWATMGCRSTEAPLDETAQSSVTSQLNQVQKKTPAPVVTLPGYGCVGEAPVSRGLTPAQAEQSVRETEQGNVFYARIMPFKGTDGVQRIAVLAHEGDDEYGEARVVVKEQGRDGVFEDVYTYKPDSFTHHYLTLVDADNDGTPEVLYDGYDGGSGGYVYRTLLYSPTRREAFWWEPTWARTEDGDERGTLTESKNLKSSAGWDLRRWFVANVNGSGTDDNDNGGLKKKCGDAVLSPPSPE